jgi:hypothetical protein
VGYSEVKDLGDFGFHAGRAIFLGEDFDPQQRWFVEDAALNFPSGDSDIGDAETVGGDLDAEFGENVNAEGPALVLEQRGQGHLNSGMI